MGAQSINQALMAKLGLDQSQFKAGMASAPKIAKRAGQSIARGIKVATASVIAMAAATAGIIAALGAMAERGQKVINVQEAFNRATGDGVAGIRLLKDATDGLVGEYDLMVQANTALTLGSAANVQQFSELARTAQQLGRALGLDAAFALNSLNIGIARQSRLILDNLGIMVGVEEANERYAASLGRTVKSLTDVEKKEAFRTEALRQARVALARLGETGATAGDMWVRFTTTLKDVRDQVSKLVAESATLKAFFAELGSFAGDILKILKADADTMKAGFEELGTIGGQAFTAGFLKAIGPVGERGVMGKVVGFFLAPLTQQVINAGKDAEREMLAALERLRAIADGVVLKSPSVPGGTGGILSGLGLGPLNLRPVELMRVELDEIQLTLREISDLPPLPIPGIEEGRAMAALGDAIRNQVISAVVDLSTAFKGVLGIVKNLAQTILRSLVNALGKAVATGGSLGDVLKSAGTPGLIGAGVGIISQFFHEGGVVRPAFAGAGSGNVPAMLQAGEVVLSRATVGRMGGPAAADQLNQGAAPPGGGLTFNFDASMIPAPGNPLAAARDAEWVGFISETLRVWEQNGGRLRG